MKTIVGVVFAVFIISSSAHAACSFEIETAMMDLKMANSSSTIKRQLKQCSERRLQQIKSNLKNNLKVMMTNRPVDPNIRSKQRYEFQANYYLLSLVNHQLN